MYRFKRLGQPEKQDSIWKKLLVPVIAIFLLMIISAHLYSKIEGWTLLDALYFETTTMLTIGYGDIVPKTEWGKIITILFSWIWISIGVYGLTIISTFRVQTFDKKVEELSETIEKITSIKKDVKKISNLFRGNTRSRRLGKK